MILKYVTEPHDKSRAFKVLGVHLLMWSEGQVAVKRRQLLSVKIEGVAMI